jgi:hypothetical protein
MTLFSIADCSNAIHAAPDAAQSDASAETIRRSIIKSIGAQENTVAVRTKGDIFMVARTNSNMNESNHEGRNNEASAIASIVAKAIGQGLEYKNIHSIRVDYIVQREPSTAVKVIDSIEFRKNHEGVFEIHVS